MQLNPSEISELIKKRVESFEAKAEARNEGTVVSVADGVVRVHGLADAMYGEMIEFPGNVFGMALNLEQDSVGAVVLGDYEDITEGDQVKCTGRILEVPVGEALLGRVVDALGNAIDGKGPIASQETSPIEKIAPGVIARKSVDQPVQTGLKSIDSMVPIGRGQRELIVRQVRLRLLSMPSSTRRALALNVFTLRLVRRPLRLPTWYASWKNTALWTTPLWLLPLPQNLLPCSS